MKEATLFMKSQLEKVDFSTSQFKKTGIKLSHLGTEKQAVSKIKKVILEIDECFLKNKELRHKNEDLEFISVVSDLLDFRLWKRDLENIPELEKRCDEGKEFWKDMDNVEVKAEILILGVNLKSNLKLFEEVQKKNHIKEQWKMIFTASLQRACPNLLAISSRAALSRNAAASCERGNSKLNRFKNDLSASMGLEMITARLRVGSNGPKLHRFNAGESVRFWIANGHEFAETQTIGKSVINRKKNEKDTKYTSKVFSSKYYCF